MLVNSINVSDCHLSSVVNSLLIPQMEISFFLKWKSKIFDVRKIAHFCLRIIQLKTVSYNL